MLFPFHNYLGPGNHLDNGPPIDDDDEIALRHDEAYETATSPEQVRQADIEAIRDFNTNYVATGNWHSVVGAIGLTWKYEVEQFTGVLYPPVDKSGWTPVIQEVLSLYTTGVMGLLVGHPMDTIKTRTQTMPDKTMIQIIANTFKLEGFRGFYKGFLAPMLTTGVTNAIFFGVYGNTIRYLRSISESSEEYRCDGFLATPLWDWNEFFSGSIAGAIITAVGAPVEAIKTRLQANAAVDNQKFKMGNECGTTWSTMKFIHSNEGITGFYRGGLALLMRDMPSYGVYTAIYQLLYTSFNCNMDSNRLFVSVSPTIGQFMKFWYFSNKFP
ncbi:mitochondrial basic amino acids transporter-like [Diaphorina citri]|uniref:Mitochondrial basic amino acids transporter-like n=1 Tax=Diaphorina citri TaxID=121845 RepID=A0A3Q0JCE6_DIACI|nr:mitochondrial basic amino acids transporter-like [Diaphorina citri]